MYVALLSLLGLFAALPSASARTWATGGAVAGRDTVPRTVRGEVATVGWGVRGAIGVGLPRDLYLLGEAVGGTAVTGTLAVDRSGVVCGPLRYVLSLEAYGTRRSGRIGSRAYAVQSARLGLGGALGYRLPSRRQVVYVGVNVRTQNDLADFDARRDDNLRYDGRVASRFGLGRRLALTASLSRALRRVGDARELADPRTRVELGVRWAITSPQ